MSRITAANAREMAARSHAARRERQSVREYVSASPQPVPQNGDYPAQRLMRVREQLGRLDAMLLTECDPQKLDRLASAQAKLAEQERVLDERPLPGTRRPRKEKQQFMADVHPV